MTNYSYNFCNDGLLDIRGATTMGLHAKQDTATAIGYFGTGLKYAIAGVLRLGGSLIIYIGEDSYQSNKRIDSFRGEPAEFITMQHRWRDDDWSAPTDLGFTTAYGKDWQPWMLFRELYSNARDELGGVERNAAGFIPLPANRRDRTQVVVHLDEFDDCYSARDEILLNPRRKITAESPRVEVANRRSEYIYYKGVRVLEQRCQFEWNFLDGMTLDESRAVGVWEAMSRFSNVLRHDVTDKQVIEDVLVHIFDGDQAPSFEQQTFQGVSSMPRKTAWCTEEFAEVAVKLWRSDASRYHDLFELACDADPSARDYHVKEMSSLQQRAVDKALDFLCNTDIADVIEVCSIKCKELGSSTLGKVEGHNIYLDPKVFDQGVKQVASTLYEEFTHFKYKLADCCYPMQTHLFNRIMSLYEEQTGDVL